MKCVVGRGEAARWMTTLGVLLSVIGVFFGGFMWVARPLSLNNSSYTYPETGLVSRWRGEIMMMQ